jgi:hypothetical protein
MRAGLFYAPLVSACIRYLYDAKSTEGQIQAPQ